jgi:hypothetical protein
MMMVTITKRKRKNENKKKQEQEERRLEKYVNNRTSAKCSRRSFAKSSWHANFSRMMAMKSDMMMYMPISVTSTKYSNDATLLPVALYVAARR